MQRSSLHGVEFGYATSVGMVRESNQDNAAVVVLPDSPMGTCVLTVVADGMGGHHGGEVASELCVRSVVEYVHLAASGLTSWAAVTAALEGALELAHSRICQYAAQESSNLGTTVTAAVYCGGEVEIIHVGDSRAYAIASNIASQITDDDSWVADQVRQGSLTEAEAAASDRRNILTQALSAKQTYKAHLYHGTLPPKSCLLLCSDGLHGVVSAEKMRRTLGRAANPKAASEALVAAANAAGGPDNITVACLWRDGGPTVKDVTRPMPAYVSPHASSRMRQLQSVLAVAVVMLVGMVGWYAGSGGSGTGGMAASAPACTVSIHDRLVVVRCASDRNCSVSYGGEPLLLDHRRSDGQKRVFTAGDMPARNRVQPLIIPLSKTTDPDLPYQVEAEEQRFTIRIAGAQNVVITLAPAADGLTDTSTKEQQVDLDPVGESNATAGAEDQRPSGITGKNGSTRFKGFATTSLVNPRSARSSGGNSHVTGDGMTPALPSESSPPAVRTIIQIPVPPDPVFWFAQPLPQDYMGGNIPDSAQPPYPQR